MHPYKGKTTELPPLRTPSAMEFLGFQKALRSRFLQIIS